MRHIPISNKPVTCYQEWIYWGSKYRKRYTIWICCWWISYRNIWWLSEEGYVVSIQGILSGYHTGIFSSYRARDMEGMIGKYIGYHTKEYMRLSYGICSGDPTGNIEWLLLIIVNVCVIVVQFRLCKHFCKQTSGNRIAATYFLHHNFHDSLFDNHLILTTFIPHMITAILPV